MFVASSARADAEPADATEDAVEDSPTGIEPPPVLTPPPTPESPAPAAPPIANDPDDSEPSPPARAPASSSMIDRVELRGLSRVKPAVVQEVLPRSVPGPMSDDELHELERRLWTMAIFDDVSVVRDGTVLRVTVREKWTLVPSADFASSKTLRDSYAYVTLTEFNTFGRAQELGAYAAYAERAMSSEVWWAEHPNSSRRASFEAGASWVGSGFFFNDSDYNWERRRSGGRFAVRLPFRYNQRWRFAILSAGYRESLDGVLAPDVADGAYGGLGLRATWDAYSWNDVTPSGLRLTIEATPGGFLSEGRVRSRHGAFAQVLAAIPLSSHFVVALNLVGEAVSPGDPNHSALVGNVAAYRFSIGNIGGIRGLTDNVYRNAAYAYGNLELRGALTLAPRWYLQGIAFVDGGTLATMDALGDTRAPEGAISTGIGVRVLPTAIATLVPRVDVGRRHVPDPAMFWTFGLSQYF